MENLSTIPIEPILEYLADRQGTWTSNWEGHLEDYPDIYHAFPKDTPIKSVVATMRKLIKKGYSGGCGCGCRGDFEITDKGLEFIGRNRVEPYTGY